MWSLTSEGRKSLIEEICKRFHHDGISRLETVGHFEKYTPLYHFRIAEPTKDFSFIFITALFGDSKIDPGLMQKGFRMQYHGSYDGLDKMVLQGIHDGMTVPFLDKEGIKRVTVNPSFRIHSAGSDLTDKDRLDFDRALVYINHLLKLCIPETIRFNINSETFSSTYHIL